MIQPGGSKVAAALLAVLSALGTACTEAVEPEPCALPRILHAEVQPNDRNVLSAIVVAELASSDSVAVQYRTSGQSYSTTPPVKVTDGSVELPVLGLISRTEYEIRVAAYNTCGVLTSPSAFFTSGTLPDDLPAYSTSGIDPSSGFVVFGARSFGLAIDNTGRIVWYHRFPTGPGLNFQAQPNGRFVARPTPAPGDPSRWIEIDPLGNHTRSLGCARDLATRLHDMIALPDGSYWLMCDQIREVDLSGSGASAQSLVMGTGVQHLAASGEILFEWSPFDHLDVNLAVLDPSDRTGSVINWTHGNAIDLDTDGNLLISFRNLSEVVKINSRTGAVVWRLGGTSNHFALGNLTVPLFARQHAVRALGNGVIQLLDNLGGSVSSVERYDIDAERRTVIRRSSHASNAGAIALTGGTAQGLARDRTLVSYGSGGSVEEIDAAGKVVWKIEGNPGYVFRAQRISSLYSPGAGDPR